MNLRKKKSDNEGGGLVPNCFWNLTLFFDIHFKNTSNFIFLGFKVPSESFFHKDFLLLDISGLKK